MAHKQLTQAQRYQLYRMEDMPLTQKEKASILGVSPSTVSRELRRNSGKRGGYLKSAHRLTHMRRRGKVKPRISPSDWKTVEAYIRCDFSPEQVSDWFKRWKILRISHERIYQYIQRDKAQGGTLYTHLRCKKPNRKRYGSRWNKNVLGERKRIEERPAIVNERQRYGDWEVDTMIGRQGGAVLVTVVERKSKLSRIGLAANKTAAAVKETLLKLLGSLSSYVHTLTYDNGPEFAQHRTISKALDCDAYFARPYCSGDRGLSENTNGLIRQYLPKGSSFDNLNQNTLVEIMKKLNNRPRKTLKTRTPNEVFYNATKIAFMS